MKRIRRVICMALILCMMMPMSAFATSGEVVEKYTGEDNISIYVRNQDPGKEINVQIGTEKGWVVQAESISNLDVPMETLVMIDNSISIKEADRGKIADFLQNMISDRIENEKIAIAVFEEKINYLCDYVADYATLKTAIDSIQYNDQETYLTDVLYEVLSKEFQKNEDVFKRIVIISDGVDNKALGYTKEELYDLLQRCMYPIYTIGCYNKKKSNSEQLENMLAISRKTMGYGILLDDAENTLDITAILKQDRNISKYVIVPEASQMDGSTKTVKLTVDGNTYSIEMKMPQKEMVVVDSPGFEEEPESVSVPEVEEAEPIEEVPKKEFPWIWVLGIAGVLLVFGAGGSLAYLLVKRNKKKQEFESVDSSILSEFDEQVRSVAEKTEFITGNVSLPSDSTVGLWNRVDTYNVILTDVHSPAKTMQIPLAGTITIGRKVGNDAVFDYERSLSGRHCEISSRNGHFYIRDLQSSNGTYVNGSKILSEVEIFSGNILKLGRLEICFEVR